MFFFENHVENETRGLVSDLSLHLNFTKDKSQWLKLQVSRPENLLKKDSSTGIFLWVPHNFSKNVIYSTLLDDWLRLLIPTFQLRFYPMITPIFLYFPSYFAFIIDNYNYGSLLRKCLRMKIFLLFTTIYSKINMTVVQAISPRQ